jgi:hypothetical protein
VLTRLGIGLGFGAALALLAEPARADDGVSEGCAKLAESQRLDPAVPPPAPPTPVLPPYTPTPFNGLRFAAYMVGSAAVIATGAGFYLGLDALENKNRANELCPAHTCKDAVAIEASRSAGRSADLATGAFVIGAATFAVVLTLYLLSPDPPPAARGFSDVYRF